MHFRPKLYAMLKPPRALVPRILAARSVHGLDESYPHIRLHCTLLDLGDADSWSASAIDELRRGLGGIQVDPFPIAFDQIRGRTLLGRAGMPGAAELHRALRRQAALPGIALPDYTFNPHISLAYKGPEPAGSHRIDPIDWLVERFHLVRSVPGRGHAELGTWPLYRRQYALAL